MLFYTIHLRDVCRMLFYLPQPRGDVVSHHTFMRSLHNVVLLPQPRGDVVSHHTFVRCLQNVVLPAPASW